MPQERRAPARLGGHASRAGARRFEENQPIPALVIVAKPSNRAQSAFLPFRIGRGSWLMNFTFTENFGYAGTVCLRHGRLKRSQPVRAEIQHGVNNREQLPQG